MIVPLKSKWGWNNFLFWERWLCGIRSMMAISRWPEKPRWWCQYVHVQNRVFRIFQPSYSIYLIGNGLYCYGFCKSYIISIIDFVQALYLSNTHVALGDLVGNIRRFTGHTFNHIYLGVRKKYSFMHNCPRTSAGWAWGLGRKRFIISRGDIVSARVDNCYWNVCYLNAKLIRQNPVRTKKNLCLDWHKFLNPWVSSVVTHTGIVKGR